MNGISHFFSAKGLECIIPTLLADAKRVCHTTFGTKGFADLLVHSVRLRSWLPSLWTRVRLRVTLLWYKPCCFSDVNYLVIMLTRYWSLSQHGQLKGLATKHTTIKWPFTNKQAQKQTENKSLTQFLIYFNFLPVIDKTTLARLVSNAGTLGKVLGTRFTHYSYLFYLSLT